MSNLEPIDEKDLNLEAKFKGEKIEGILAENQKEPDFKIEKEAPREIAPSEKDNSYGKILAKVKGQAQADAGQDDVKKDAENVWSKTDADSQIRHLVDIAMAKGVLHAVRVARHLEDNYVLDMFHDKLLADELHDALMKKGLLEDI